MFEREEMSSANSKAPRGYPEPFHLRTEERLTKPRHYCSVCAIDDEGELCMPKLNLPRLCGDCALVTTKLGETITRSTVGHVFDLCIPMGTSSSPPEYNCLHDPHLRAFFSRRYMRNRLVAQGYITPSGEVLCTRREYNVYHHFLKSEFGKVKQLREECKKMIRGHDSKEGRMMVGHLAADRQALALKQQRVSELKETQHAAKMEAIRERRDKKALTVLKLEADKRAKRRTAVSSVPTTAVSSMPTTGVSSVQPTMPMEQQNVKDTDEHSQQLATTKGQLVPEQQKVDELENQLLQRKRVAYLLNKYREEKRCQNGGHTQATTSKGEANLTNPLLLESKTRTLNSWKVQFDRLQKHWKTMVESVTQPTEPHPPTNLPCAEPLSAKNSLIHHHTRISSRDPSKKISVANPPKPTQCVRFNMEPKVHLFSKEVAGGHGNNSGLGAADDASGDNKGTVTEEEWVVVRELEPVGVAS